MQLTNSQEKTVQKLFDIFLNKDNNSKEVYFIAPTGSGKTLMASDFISKVLANELANGKKSIFVVATISNADLPKEFAYKLDAYQEFHDFQDYKVEYISSYSKNNKSESIPEFILEDRKVFVFGVRSFGKNTIFYQNRTLKTFLLQAKLENYQLFFIRDEAHIGRKESTGITGKILENFDSEMTKNSDFILKMTATPLEGMQGVEMTQKDMLEDEQFLLKNEPVIYNKEKFEKNNLNYKKSDLNFIFVDEAMKKFKEIKKAYWKLDIGTIINPALLIQISNNWDIKKYPIEHQRYLDGLKLIEERLSFHELRYLKYVDNSPKVVGTTAPADLKYASKINSEIDAIIFKVGPATGWDIPRANMLLQLRSVSSDTLNKQTIGRIKRNPVPGLYKNNITDKYYLWSDYQEPSREEAHYALKEKFYEEKFITGLININSHSITKEIDSYKKNVLEHLKSPIFLNKVIGINVDYDIYNDSFDCNNTPSKIKNFVYLKIYNINKIKRLETNYKISFFVDELIKISVKFNKNIEIVKYVFIKSIDILQKIKADNTSWPNKMEPYTLKEDIAPLKKYTIFKGGANFDNQGDKKFMNVIDISNYENYGYRQISNLENKSENKQYFDSKPELKFFDRFWLILTSEQKSHITFFAKMPAMSSIYFEYYSKELGGMAKSFVDFIIKYKNKTIMVEVKGFGKQDYNEKKTEDLIDGYKMYARKFYKKNVHLILYKYGDSLISTHNLQGNVGKEWQTDQEFSDLFNKIFKDNQND